MSLLHALVLALVQGLTEFLPVSSSGHLALADALLERSATGTGAEGVFYAVLLHVSTMLAVIAYFRRELWALRGALVRGEDGTPARRVVLLLGVASVPTAAIGLALKDVAERAFESPPWVGAGLLLTSVLLLSTARRRRDEGGPEVSGEPGAAAGPLRWIGDLAGLRVRDAAVVGIAQGIAVWPGVSRSGSTIAAALVMGVPGPAAARFSLLASLPAIAGGFLLELGDLEGVPSDLAGQLAGAVLAFVVGLLAIGWLMAAVRGARLPWFAAYTAVLGLLALGTAWLA